MPGKGGHVTIGISKASAGSKSAYGGPKEDGGKDAKFWGVSLNPIQPIIVCVLGLGVEHETALTTHLAANLRSRML